MTSEAILAILNAYATDFLREDLIYPGGPFRVYDPRKLLPRVQLVPERDAFTLDPPQAALAILETKGSSAKGAIIRFVVSYLWASRVAAGNDKRLFYYEMSLIIADALAAMQLTLGDLSFRKVTFTRPGMPGVYFKELENSAGYELRCWVGKKENEDEV